MSTQTNLELKGHLSTPNSVYENLSPNPQGTWGLSNSYLCLALKTFSTQVPPVGFTAYQVSIHNFPNQFVFFNNWQSIY